ncbi:hypothetical protein N7462_009330 [Penicillium macrosclerotiorum]|uniref:uncharacterized protein n=1 Tax=Penicillium macrosclerotiorum TaxID=303699 RepID=UPI002548AAC2|nr:uncharacterized protein N7462_009330 [Penicillium macrosclerotiorum]KAJ5673891.1 hypothetical protein N7462_009330 [Penicillium macrosclerotiorum]
MKELDNASVGEQPKHQNQLHPRQVHAEPIFATPLMETSKGLNNSAFSESSQGYEDGSTFKVMSLQHVLNLLEEIQNTTNWDKPVFDNLVCANKDIAHMFNYFEEFNGINTEKRASFHANVCVHKNVACMFNLLEENRNIVTERHTQYVRPWQSRLYVTDAFELSILIEHLAAVHTLLEWPSIKRLVNYKYDVEYMRDLELKCDLGSILCAQVDIPYTNDDRLPVNHDVLDEGDSKGKQSKQVQTRETPNVQYSSDENAEIDEHGWLQLDGGTVHRYYRNYFDHMHKLHPFLSQSAWIMKLDSFIKKHSPKTVLSTTDTKLSCSGKKFEYAHSDSDEDFHGIRWDSVGLFHASLRVPVDYDVGDAVVLLVLALGAMCESKFSFPGHTVDEKVIFNHQDIPCVPNSLKKTPSKNDRHVTNSVNSTHSKSGFITPIASSFDNTSRFIGPSCSLSIFTSEQEEDSSKRKTSCPDNHFEHKRSLHVIPGLALYGFASRILAGLHGGIGLEFAQARLLAGLYAGHLARPMHAHGWISQAAYTCQTILRMKRYGTLEEGASKDLFEFAYWTCLQLESEFFWDVDLPATGISEVESEIPNGRYTMAFHDEPSVQRMVMIMPFYSAQVHLYGTLQRVYQDFYRDASYDKITWSSMAQEGHSMSLDLWRMGLPDIIKWDDTDPPATDINAARMRATYYSTMYIIRRPLLYSILHYEKLGPHFGSDNWTPPNGSLRELPEKLHHACRVCIESAILNTEAFDGIEGRLLIPNIFSLAHTQFGNMLVLSATYTSSLSELIERDVLRRLLKRTIQFLLRNGNNSPALQADAQILIEIYEKIFESSSENP